MFCAFNFYLKLHAHLLSGHAAFNFIYSCCFFIYPPINLPSPSHHLSLSFFHSLSFLKAKRLCRLLGHFPLCHRRSCCCCCPRGKYASISFTPCNVVGLNATPDCAPGLLFNYFVNVFFLSFLPLLSSSFFFFLLLLFTLCDLKKPVALAKSSVRSGGDFASKWELPSRY